MCWRFSWFFHFRNLSELIKWQRSWALMTLFHWNKFVILNIITFLHDDFYVTFAMIIVLLTTIDSVNQAPEIFKKPPIWKLEESGIWIFKKKCNQCNDLNNYSETKFVEKNWLLKFTLQSSGKKLNIFLPSIVYKGSFSWKFKLRIFLITSKDIGLPN